MAILPKTPIPRGRTWDPGGHTYYIRKPTGRRYHHYKHPRRLVINLLDGEQSASASLTVLELIKIK